MRETTKATVVVLLFAFIFILFRQFHPAQINKGTEYDLNTYYFSKSLNVTCEDADMKEAQGITYKNCTGGEEYNPGGWADFISINTKNNYSYRSWGERIQ